MKKNRVVSFALIVLVAIVSFTCKYNIGMGSQIDILPPVGVITSPDAGEAPIRGSFVLKGTASDDDGIQSVSVVFENIEDKDDKHGPYNAEVFGKGSDSATWTINVDNNSTGTESGHPLVKLYPIPDGEYTAIVTVTDKGGKTYETRRTYKIDNTPPVFIASRPSLSAALDAINPPADEYGAVMKIVGSAADMYELSSITLKADGLAKPITKKNKEVSVDIVMASSPEQAYTDLLTAAGGSDKPLKAVITLQDNARISNESTDDNNEGNESTFYYIKNEIEGSIDLDKYTAKVISDYFSGKKGKDGGTPHEQAIYDLRSDVSAQNILYSKRVTPTPPPPVHTDPSEPPAKKSVFALNPDKSPGFKVVGAHPVFSPGGTTSPAQMVFDSSSSLTVELYPNRDGNALVTGTDYAASQIKIELRKGTTAEDLKEGIYEAGKPSVVFFDAANLNHLNSGVQKSGDIIKITKPLAGIETGFYRINVTGHDVKGNSSFVPYNTEGKPSGGYLIIEFKSAGTPYIFPQQPATYQKGDFNIVCTVQNLAGGSVYYRLDTPIPTNDTVPSPGSPLLLANSDSGRPTMYEKIVDTSSLTLEGYHVVYLRAAGSNGSAGDKVGFVLDKTPPKEPVLTSPTETVFNTYSRTFKGTAEDNTLPDYTNLKGESCSGVNGSGIEKVVYKIGKKIGGTVNFGDETPARLITTPPAAGSPAGTKTRYQWEAIVSFSQKTDNYVLVTAYDKAGNKKDKQFGPYTVNTNSPQIKFEDIRFSLGTAYTEVSPVTLVKQNAVIGSNAKRTASFRIFTKLEPFGIKTVAASIGSGVEKNGTKTNPSLTPDGYEEWTVNNITLTEGNPNFRLYVESNSGTITEWQIPIIVDFTAPEVVQTSPDLGNVFFKEVKLRGNILDKIASGIPSGVDKTTVKYRIGNVGYGTSHVVSGDELSKIEYAEGPWTITIPDITKYKTGFGAVSPSGSSTVYTIPVQIQVSDKAGNSCTSDTFNIKFDPAGGAPFAELNTPKQGDAYGGEVLISGSARVANPASGITVREIYLQLGQSQAQLESNTSWSLAGTDYGAAGGVKIYGSGSDDVYYWNCILPDSVKTAILGGAPSKEVFLRVKAKNSSGAFGDWSLIRKFTINTDVAQFTGMKLIKSGGVPEDYSPNSVWLKGDGFKITGAVSHSAGIKNTIKTNSESLPDGYESLFVPTSNTWFTPQSSVPPANLPGYTFEIPIKTTHYTNQAGNIQFNISAVDNRTDGTPVPVSYPIILKYDNSKPAVASGDFKMKSASAAFTAGTFTTIALESAKKGLYRVLVNNQVYTIQTISGTDVTLNGASTLTGTFDYGIVERPAMIFDGDDGSDYQITGIASDTGSGVQKITAKLEVAGNTGLKTVSVDMRADTSGSNKVSRERGDMVSFKGSLNTEGVPNGKGRLTITAYDETGNELSEQISDIIVKNKPIEIKKIAFKTDLSGDGNYQSNEEHKAENIGSFTAQRDFEGSVTAASKFTFKNPTKSELSVTLKGGYGTNARVSLHKAKVVGSTITIGDEIAHTSGGISAGEYTVTLVLNGTLNIGDDPKKKLILKVTDESTGAAPPASSSVPVPYWHAQANIEVGLDVEDDIAPKGFIMPLFYNSDEGRITRPDDLPLVSVVYDVVKNTAGEVTEVKAPLGHIQLAPVSDLGNTHPSVSGKVRLRGIAYDNIRLKKLALSGAEIGPVSNEFTNGAWSTTSPLKIVKNKLSNTGHYVEWEYEWTTVTPAKAQTITLTVTDAKAGTSNTSASSAVSDPPEKTAFKRPGDRSLVLQDETDTAAEHQFIRLYEGDKSYLVQITSVESHSDSGNRKRVSWDKTSVPVSITKYKLYTDASHSPDLIVNIVPYVTKIETSLSELGGENDPDLYARTALGRYPVRAGETIKIHGFNLNGAAAKIGGGPSGSLSGSASPWDLTVASAAKSGKLELTVGSGSNAVSAINNNNNASNNKPYNKVLKTANNDKLTDDVELDVWEFNSRAALPVRGYIAEPVMRINPVNGIIGFAFANGPDYFSMSKGQGSSYERWHRNSDDFRQIDFVYDSSGTSHGVATAQDLNSTSEHASNLSYITGIWGHLNDPQGNDSYVGACALRLEKIGQVGKMDGSGGSILDKNRIEHPSIAVVKGTDTRLYLAYYDSLNDQIRFKAGTLTTAMNWDYIRGKDEKYKKNDGSSSNIKIGAWETRKRVPHPKNAGQFIEYGATFPRKPFGQFVDEAWPREVIPYNQDNVSIVAGKYMQGSTVVDTGNKTGRYLSLAVVPGTDATKDVAVLIWFDEKSKKLKYTYNKYPAKEDTTPAAAANPPAGIIDNPTKPEIADLKFDTRTIPPRNFGTGTGDGYWNTTVKNVFTEPNIGEYCKIAVDKNGGIHIAAYNFATASLHYAYLPQYDDAGTFKTSVVDSYGIAGTDIFLDVALSAGGNPIPYIGYYSASAGGAKLAYLVEPASGSGFDQDAEGVEGGYFTGKWEVTCIPTESRVEKDNINVGVWKDAATGMIKNSTPAPAGTVPPTENEARKQGTVYGNGTANPVLGYAIKDSIDGYIETAQKK